MHLRKKHIVILAAVVVILAVGGYGARELWKRQHPISSDILLYGNIDVREADLAFNVAGRVQKMLVEEGDSVEAGQLLATLDASTYEAEVEAAKARLDVQQYVLNRLLSGSRSQEIQMAAAEVRANEADLADARSTLNRTAALAADGFAPLQRLDNDRSRVMSLEAQLAAAEQALSLAIEGARDEDIAQARAQLRVVRADLDLALQLRDFTKLYADSAGVVKTRIVEPGNVVLANTPVYTIALSDTVWVRTYVSELDLARVVPGMAAEVFTDSAPDTMHDGWVGFVSPVAEFTPKSVETQEVRTSLVYRLRVYVANPDNSLRQGMPVTVRLHTDPRQGDDEEASSQ